MGQVMRYFASFDLNREEYEITALLKISIRNSEIKKKAIIVGVKGSASRSDWDSGVKNLSRNRKLWKKNRKRPAHRRNPSPPTTAIFSLDS